MTSTTSHQPLHARHVAQNIGHTAFTFTNLALTTFVQRDMAHTSSHVIRVIPTTRIHSVVQMSSAPLRTSTTTLPINEINSKMTTMSLPCSSPTPSLPLLLSTPITSNSNRSSLLLSVPTPITIQCRLVRDREQSFRSNLIRLKRLAAGRTTEKVGVPTSVPVRVAHDLLLAGHRYLDVRTIEEFSAGHAVGAVNVPYMLKVVDGMAKNPDFLEEVSRHFGKDAEIIVGCKIGKRSLMAATDLSAAGYTGITDIAGGFTAWTANGLPTE